MFDLLIVAVLRNAEKQPLFSVAERVDMLREVTKQWTGVEIDVFDGLLVDYARKRGAGVILRGIRAVSDYEYELQMALMNRKLEPRLETVFMLPGLTYSYLSSKLVRESPSWGLRSKAWCRKWLSSVCAPKFRSRIFLHSQTGNSIQGAKVQLTDRINRIQIRRPRRSSPRRRR